MGVKEIIDSTNFSISLYGSNISGMDLFAEFWKKLKAVSTVCIRCPLSRIPFLFKCPFLQMFFPFFPRL